MLFLFISIPFYMIGIQKMMHKTQLPYYIFAIKTISLLVDFLAPTLSPRFSNTGGSKYMIFITN